ncbi:hypothetical protein SUGI_0666730 [Cryptomeria japonica]|nr:hypothetical protein SUGI_0666730 [Cryptomeria japonica]
MASSSSFAKERSTAFSKQYDAFISHRGPDVKETLAKQLYERLKARQCGAFLDRQEIEGGDSITSAIENAIRSSVVQIAIFSKRFAESKWCLEELVLMLQQTDALFIPVFYDVHPWELRHIENNKSQYAAAFSDYRRNGRNVDKLDEWKKALAFAADISGYELSQYQEDLCEKIVSRVLQETEKMKPLHVAKYPVGLADLVQDFENSCSQTAGTVGIFGLGGVGKTTLARELFNRKRSSYSASSFLSDVRESHAKGKLHYLQSQLLKDLFPEDQKVKDLDIRSVDQGIGELKDRLGRARHLHFLIILDDIDQENQLDALLPEGVLGTGSLVIITTRDKSVLRGADIRYKMKGMDKDHAKQLFCKHAFRGRDPPAAYEKLIKSFVQFCGGLPLSLKVLGAHVYRRDKHYWKLELEKVKKIQPKDIMKRLKISIDGLDREEKQIFIDIACLFNKKEIPEVERGVIVVDYMPIKDKAISIWKASGWSAEHAVQTLQDKCLVEVVMGFKYPIFRMHHHLRDLGRQMADELGPPRLWRPDILKSMEEKGFNQILEETKGRCFQSFWDLALEQKITYFIAETGLVWLEIRPSFVLKKISSRIPSWIPLQKLYFLNVWEVEELWSIFQQQFQTNMQASFELRKLWIWDSHSLGKLPESMAMFRHLEELRIVRSLEKTDLISLVQSLGQTDITSLAQSLKQLSNLRSLFLECTEEYGFCRGSFDLSKSVASTDLDSSASSFMVRLEKIELSGPNNISKLLISGEICPILRSVKVGWMENLKEMDLKQLEILNTLTVYQCSKLETISGLSTQHRLEEIIIEGCGQLQHVEGVEELPGLKSLVVEMPDDGCAWVRNYIHGLQMLPLKKIILIQQAMGEASSKFNANFFSDVIGAQAISEIGREEYTQYDSKVKMKSSSSEITIYAFLATSLQDGLTFKFDEIEYWLPSQGDVLITVLLNKHDSEDKKWQ